MNRQNEMMESVWLLNAIDNSAFETRELCAEFLRQGQGFKELRRSIPANSGQGDYLEQEIKRNLEGFEGLRKKIQEVIDILRSPEGAGEREQQ